MGSGEKRELDNRASRSVIELKVEYRRLDTFFADYTKNISKGGTFIKTNNPLEIGTQCHFSLSVPGRAEPFALDGEVIWANRINEVQNPIVSDRGMGIRFLFASENERIEFEEEVRKLVHDELGEEAAQELGEL